MSIRSNRQKDGNGNPIGQCVGGLLDGMDLYSRDFKEGETFIPGLIHGAKVDRPVYRFEQGRFVFVGYEVRG